MLSFSCRYGFCLCLFFGFCFCCCCCWGVQVWCSCMATVLYYIAERYGQDWMVVAYAVYILLISSFFFGETYAQTSGFACFYTGILSMITIIFFSKLDYPENPVEDKSTLLTASQMVCIYRWILKYIYIWYCGVLCIIVRDRNLLTGFDSIRFDSFPDS